MVTKSLLVPFCINTVLIPEVASVTVTLKTTLPVTLSPEEGSITITIGLMVSTVKGLVSEVFWLAESSTQVTFQL